jgi:hypothetical protein
MTAMLRALACSLGLHRWGPPRSMTNGEHVRNCPCGAKHWLG